MAHGASTRPLPQSLSSTTSSRIDSHCLGLAVLNLVTVIWGSQHALIKDLVTRLKVPSVLNALRFSIAAACFGLLQIRRCHVHAWPLTMVRAGAELALWQTLGFTLQLFGLSWTTASRSAFLLYLNAPLVPIFAWLMGERLIGLRTYGAASLAVVGTLMLTYDGGPPNMGDMFSVAAAAASAMFIVRLGHFSARINDAAGLNTVALGVTALLSAAFVATSVATSPDRAQAWTALCDDVWSLLPTAPPQSLRPCMELIYLSLVTTALTGWLQAWGQARVKPHEAVVIYTMDPVYGAFFAWLLLGEVLHVQGLLGIGLVVSANVLRQVPWEAWDMTRAMVTPRYQSAEALLRRMADKAIRRGVADDKLTPLLASQTVTQTA